MSKLEIEDFIEALKTAIAEILDADENIIVIDSGMSLAEVSRRYAIDSLDEFSVLMTLESELDIRLPYSYEWNKNKSVRTLFLDFKKFNNE